MTLGGSEFQHALPKRILVVRSLPLYEIRCAEGLDSSPRVRTKGQHIMPHIYVLLLLVTALLVAPSSATAHESGAHGIDPRAFGAIMPRLSPDGAAIAFSYQGAIWRMPTTGGEMTRLTRGAGFDVEPAWSSD